MAEVVGRVFEEFGDQGGGGCRSEDVLQWKLRSVLDKKIISEFTYQSLG